MAEWCKYRVCVDEKQGVYKCNHILNGPYFKLCDFSNYLSNVDFDNLQEHCINYEFSLDYFGVKFETEDAYDR